MTNGLNSVFGLQSVHKIAARWESNAPDFREQYDVTADVKVGMTVRGRNEISIET
jgi:hypothetical protein